MFLLETINSTTINTGLRDILRSGSFVTFHVKDKLDSDLYRISIHGKIMNVRSHKVLKAGEQIRARVFWTGNRLRLEVSENRDPLSSLLQRSGLSNSPAVRLTAEALLRSNMPFLPVYFEQIQAVLRKRDTTDLKIIRLLLIMLDKGIPLNEKNISEMENLTSNYGHGEKKERKNARDSNDKNKGKTQREDLEAQIKRSDSGTELLKYFNHRIAEHDNWIIIPIEYSFARPGKGILKIKVDRNKKLSAMTLFLNDGAEWDFHLSKNGDTGLMKINGPECGELKFNQSLINFREKLHNNGIQTDDINNGTLVTDGFTEIGLEQPDSIDFVI